jgi:hypothetical protein
MKDGSELVPIEVIQNKIMVVHGERVPTTWSHAKGSQRAQRAYDKRVDWAIKGP